MSVYAKTSGRLLGTGGMAIIRTDTSPELWQIVLDVLVALGTVGAVVADTAVRSCRPQCRLRYHAVWQPGQVQTAAGGGAGRRSAKNAAAPMSTAKRTTRRGRTLPERVYSPGRSEPTGDRP